MKKSQIGLLQIGLHLCLIPIGALITQEQQVREAVWSCDNPAMPAVTQCSAQQHNKIWNPPRSV